MRKFTSGMTMLLGCLNSLQCVQRAGAVEVGSITPVEDRVFIIDGSGSISLEEFRLLALLGAWGVCPSCVEDTNLDGNVNVTDLLSLLAGWG